LVLLADLLCVNLSHKFRVMMLVKRKGYILAFGIIWLDFALT
jgi:hypothetical protein